MDFRIRKGAFVRGPGVLDGSRNVSDSAIPSATQPFPKVLKKGVTLALQWNINEYFNNLANLEEPFIYSEVSPGSLGLPSASVF